jgi:parvulin-like peptidyl-prolyl isomerase
MIDSHPTPPKLDAFTFALESDAFGGPVESPAGWHLVKVTDVRDAHNTDFEE